MLTQSEVDYLLEALKVIVNKGIFSMPRAGERKEFDVISEDRKERFIIDINRAGRINLRKQTLQERYRKTEILLRLDVSGPPHTNPNGETISCPHLHVYREGFGAKWAHPVPADLIISDDVFSTLISFLEYCNVTNTHMLFSQEEMEI